MELSCRKFKLETCYELYEQWFWYGEIEYAFRKKLQECLHVKSIESYEKAYNSF